VVLSSARRPREDLVALFTEAVAYDRFDGDRIAERYTYTDRDTV
jgi:hypothetical protein